MNILLGIVCVLLASVILTRFTKPSDFAPVSLNRKKKNKRKLSLTDREPFLSRESAEERTNAKDTASASPNQ